MDRHQQISDGDGMREVDEVRMFPEQLERTPEKILCPETCEEREERERCADGVEDAVRADAPCRYPQAACSRPRG